MLPHEVTGFLLHSYKVCSTVLKNKLSVSMYLELLHGNINAGWCAFCRLFLLKFCFVF